MEIDTNGINLGDEVKCLVTGGVGTATAIVVYISGCVQIGVKFQFDEKKYPETHYVDIQVLEKTGKSLNVKQKQAGAERMDCPKN